MAFVNWDNIFFTLQHRGYKNVRFSAFEAVFKAEDKEGVTHRFKVNDEGCVVKL